MTLSMSIGGASLAVTMLAGWPAVSHAVRAVNAVEAAQVAKTLSDAKVQAYQLREDVDEMESYTRSNTTWEAHVDAINRIKEDVNAMGRLITKLQADRDGIEYNGGHHHLDKYPQRVKTAEYQNYLEAIAPTRRIVSLPPSPISSTMGRASSISNA